MAEKFGFSVHHCKDLLLSAGVHTIFAHPNGSSYNAFLSMKAKELRESEFMFYFYYYSVQHSILGDPDETKFDTVTLGKMFGAEYGELSPEEKEEIRLEHVENKKEAVSSFRWPSAKGRVLDVQNTLELIKHLVCLHHHLKTVYNAELLPDWWITGSCRL
jgi:hypothetical protein